MNRDRQIFTVGHSNHRIDFFIRLLMAHAVELVADVRSSPYSRFNPQFNQAPLAEELQASGLKYLFVGRELGARTDDPSCYEHGRVRYDRLAATSAFRQGIERILHESEGCRIALMCAEKEPLECHRTLLVGRALADMGANVAHILADGSIEQHEATLQRLLSETGMSELDLFKSQDEVIGEAVARQERKIAYVDAAHAEGSMK